MRYSKGMFEENRPGRPKNTKKLPVILGIVAVVLAGFAVVLAMALFQKLGTHVPQSIAQKVNFPIYLPKRLPGGFKIADDSFNYTENVLLYSAEDTIGTTLSFSEQKKPAKLNFDDFYKKNLVNVKTLSGIPYPAVVGTATVGERKVVSAVPGETWVVITAPLSLSDDDFRSIVRSLHKQ